MAHNHGASGHAARRKHRAARCEAYKASGRREVNKAIKLARHMARHITDSAAEVVYYTLPSTVRDRAREIVQKRKQACGMWRRGFWSRVN